MAIVVVQFGEYASMHIDISVSVDSFPPLQEHQGQPAVQI